MHARACTVAATASSDWPAAVRLYPRVAALPVPSSFTSLLFLPPHSCTRLFDCLDPVSALTANNTAVAAAASSRRHGRDQQQRAPTATERSRPRCDGEGHPRAQTFSPHRYYQRKLPPQVRPPSYLHGPGPRSPALWLMTPDFNRVDGVTRTLARLLEHLQLEGHTALVLGPESGMVRFLAPLLTSTRPN